MDDVLPTNNPDTNNPDFENYQGQMYPVELEIKDRTESDTSASYLDLLLSIGRDGQHRTSFYGRYGYLIKHYDVSLSQMLHDILGHEHLQ